MDVLATTPWEPSIPSSADTLALIAATQAALQKAAKTVHDSGGNTVCTVVVDSSGNAVTLMSSIFKRFGAGYTEPSKGVGDLAGRSDFGGAQAVQRLANGELWAVSDQRKDGAALAG